MTATLPDTSTRIDRRAFVTDLIGQLPDDVLIVTGLGSPSYDVFATGYRPRTFHLWGAMGAAVPMGLGLALAQRDTPVVVITGDGEQLMGVGALGTVAVQSPPNLTIVVLDNGHFGETGMQRSHAGLNTDLAQVARGFGIPDAATISSADETRELAALITAQNGTAFRRVLIDVTEPPRALPPRDGVANKNAVRAALGFETF
ncbi:phosphonopyruvate decarboxylase [Branchiibius hedensis]|uniref:Phosphonopyruvate decarboxylase n=1 Tax=Branchiibius hedensis TaxID=672460 RepID=A0A2Y9C226_9MICO|nr:thiamine pyrophosphate-dependent enzyme [Branchiibius hedensis]PWJ26531.1 phosphonopyruvate decarboxylase [Branchiibius hedensis]SSA35343.1 phosphonopyruvate decarboxylase [Branchiibius hedensis]